MRSSACLALAVATCAATPALACPDWQAAPSFGQIDLYEGFEPDPWVRNITAGGQYSVPGCLGDPSMSGTVAAKPDFDIYYTTSGTSTLTVAVTSAYDTMLLIRDPYGNWWFDDDSGGDMNPLISFPQAAPGLYDVWIGSYQGGRGLPGQLLITERY